MNHSDSITKLAAALAKAQAEMPAAPMNATNPFLHNRYADLGSVIEASRPILAKNGLSVSQFPTGGGSGIGVSTILMHESGEWLESEMTLPLGDEKGKSQAQVAGSIITYLRRYAYASVLGMYADEDTDGEPSKGNGQGKQQQNSRPPAQASKTQPPAQNRPAPANGELTYEQACEVLNHEGVKYGDLDNVALANMTGGINKALAKNGITAEQKAEYERKRDAVVLILKTRNGGK